jgi:hypothetical protein
LIAWGVIGILKGGTERGLVTVQLNPVFTQNHIIILVHYFSQKKVSIAKVVSAKLLTMRKHGIVPEVYGKSSLIRPWR